MRILRATVNARARAIEEIATTVSTCLRSLVVRLNDRVGFAFQVKQCAISARGSSLSVTFRRSDVEFLQDWYVHFSHCVRSYTRETRASIHVIFASQHRCPFHKLDAR